MYLPGLFISNKRFCLIIGTKYRSYAYSFLSKHSGPECPGFTPTVSSILITKENWVFSYNTIGAILTRLSIR